MQETRPPSLPWRAALGTLHRLPQGALSRGFGWIADRRVPRPLRRPLLGGFARAVGIQVREAEQELQEYPSLNAFFVRRLKPGLRSWPGDHRHLASPVDGVVGQCGVVRDGVLLQAKGRRYRAGELLGDDPAAEPFEGGLYITLYLSPRHYHRIHTPLPGRVVAARHIPGALMPVNAPAVAAVDRLFARNERLLAWLHTAVGPVAVAAVGAYNVGRISAAFDPAWGGRDGDAITNRGTRPPSEREYDPGLPVEAGDELMAFHLGSTVVLLTPPGLVLDDDVIPGREIQVGQVMARPGPP